MKTGTSAVFTFPPFAPPPADSGPRRPRAGGVWGKPRRRASRCPAL